MTKSKISLFMTVKECKTEIDQEVRGKKEKKVTVKFLHMKALLGVR